MCLRHTAILAVAPDREELASCAKKTPRSVGRPTEAFQNRNRTGERSVQVPSILRQAGQIDGCASLGNSLKPYSLFRMVSLLDSLVGVATV